MTAKAYSAKKPVDSKPQATTAQPAPPQVAPRSLEAPAAEALPQPAATPVDPSTQTLSSQPTPTDTAPSTITAAPMLSIPSPAPTPASSSDTDMPTPTFIRPAGMNTLMTDMPRREGAGSATQAAAFLLGALSTETTELTEGLSSNMRMEEFTQAREERMKRQGATIITADGPSISKLNTQSAAATPASPPASTQAEVETGGEAYQPKVSTWGVFPRPNDMSAAFGGGKNIKYGGELETKEQKEKRESAYRTALVAYKKTSGTEIDPVLEAEALVLYEEGLALIGKGLLRAAYEKFNAASSKVPVKTKIGGQATLQKAVALDSLGESKMAEKLYKTLTGHPIPAVSKKARQMLFGFEAMTFMKTSSASMGVKNTDYASYFRRMADRNRVYVSTEKDRQSDEELARLATAIAVGVLVAPLMLVAGLAATR
ncbi:MAG: hypothetical protein WDW38_005636 [Sanguina aurantia]